MMRNQSPSAAEAARDARGGTPNIPPADKHIEVDGAADHARRARQPEPQRRGERCDRRARSSCAAKAGSRGRASTRTRSSAGWSIVGGPGLGAYRPIYEGNNTVGRAANQRIPIDFGDDSHLVGGAGLHPLRRRRPQLPVRAQPRQDQRRRGQRQAADVGRDIAGDGCHHDGPHATRVRAVLRAGFRLGRHQRSQGLMHATYPPHSPPARARAARRTPPRCGRDRHGMLPAVRRAGRGRPADRRAGRRHGRPRRRRAGEPHGLREFPRRLCRGDSRRYASGSSRR